MADGVPTWEEVARDHGRFLYNVAYRLAGNDDDAQDLVQESLIRVRKGLERYEPGSLEGWLARIVTNVFLDEVRRRKRRPTDALPDDPEPGAAPRARGRRGAHRALRRGPARARGAARGVPRAGRALRRRATSPTSRSRTATGVPIGTVRSRIHRGRRMLRAAFDGRRGDAGA